MQSDDLKLCGLAAVRARFARDAGSIRRLYFDYATGRKVGLMCRALAAARRIYRCVEASELERIAGTVHHGGIVALVVPRALREPRPGDAVGWARRRASVLLLDRIANPHNLGALARTAAFFGIRHVVLPRHPDAALPGDAAHRVAEGALEALEVFQVNQLAPFACSLAAAGYQVIGAATRGGGFDFSRPIAGPVALALGNEEKGLAADVAAACTRLVTIPGSGAVESLNVSVAAAVLMWESIARPETGQRKSRRR